MKIKGIEQAISLLKIDESKIKQALEQGGELILNQAKANVAIQGDDFQGLVHMEAKRMTREERIKILQCTVGVSPYGMFK